MLALVMSATICTIPSYAENGIYKEIYVSERGSDSFDGSKSSPFRTIEKAKEYVRTISGDMSGDIVVNVEDGTYFLEDTLVFRNEDSGKNGHKIIYRGSNMPLISGGVKVGAFEPTEYTGIYKAPVDGITMMHEMYVDGKKAYLASANKIVKAIDYYQDPRSIYTYDGMIMSRADIGEYENPEDIEFSWLVNWKYSTALVRDIIPDPENPDQVIVLMQQSWWDRISNYSDASYCAKPYRAFEMKNAFEFLDKPGEFYYNKKEKFVYYMPREGENLESATVIAPRIDKLMKFDGNDEFDKVKNIRIEGFEIAHSAFYGSDEGGVEGAQAQLFSRTNGVPWYVPSGISLARAEGIEFEGNYIYGFGCGAIELSDAVDKAVINGNAFSDIGDAAIAIGKSEQGARSSLFDVSFTDQRVIPPQDAGDCNLTDSRVKLSASYFGNFMSLTGGNTWYEDADKSYDEVWESDPEAPARGERSWIRYDFEGRYTLSKVRIKFARTIPAEMRSGFEIIVSNDREFREENCVVVARQDGPAADLQDYEIDTNGEAYRFLLIRTINPTRLAVSRIWAFTQDRKPYTTGVLTTNNTVSNNYITRCGETILQAGGVAVMYTRGLNLSHNEISDIPYSGIMVGWGWRNFDDTNYDNKIDYNYVHNTNLLLDDGGGIYTLSNQKNSTIVGNYVKGVVQGRSAIYTDEGSSDFYIADNVMEDVTDDYFIWQSSIRDNQYLNGYGWIPQHRSDGTNNVEEPIKKYAPGNAPGEAYMIMQNAGLESEYKYLKDLVYEADLEIMNSRDACDLLEHTEIEYLDRYTREVAEIMLSEGHFGNNPGDYPAHYYYDIQNAYNEVIGYKSNDHFNSILRFRELVNKAAEDIPRLSLGDMIKYCEENLNSTPVSKDKSVEGSVLSKDKNIYKDKLEKIKNASISCDGATERNLLLELEDANREFENAKASTDLVYLYVENILGEEIDRENKVVTVYMPSNADLTKCSFDVMCKGNAEAAIVEETISIVGDCVIPVYSKDSGKYTFWKVNVVKVDENKWSTSQYDRTMIQRRPDGTTYLSPYGLDYINSKFFKKEEMQKITFTPMGVKENEIILIFSAGDGISFDHQSHSQQHDHLRMEIVNGLGKIIKSENGVNTLVKENVKVDLCYGKENQVGIKALMSSGGMYLYSIMVNGSLVDVFITDQKFTSGYTGICSKEMGVVVNSDNT